MKIYERKNDEKILVITNCSKSKADLPARVRELFKGQLFRMLVKFSEQNNFSMKVISGKHGLLDLDDCIEPYDQKIRTKDDIKRIRENTFYHLIDLYPRYDKIIVLLGKNYLKTVEPLLDHKSLVVFDKKGLFWYLSIISKLLKLPREQILTELKKFQKIECIHASCGDVVPNNCHFCDFAIKKECHWSLHNNEDNSSIQEFKIET